MGGIALLGALGTAYLTGVKLTGGSAACPTSGCEQVLSSPYATVFGLPLTLFGFFAYATMGIMAIAPLAIKPDQKQTRLQVENSTWLLLFAGAVVMAIFSAYLMYLLVFEIKVLCLYCLASALFTVILLVLTVMGREWRDVGQLFFTGIVVGMIALIATLGVYAQVSGSATPTGSTAGQVGPAITTTSGQAEVSLAQHLKQVGAKMYGAWWCPHCHDQKQLFGETAAREFPYVECDPKGSNPQPDQCQAAGVESYPTWEIKGKIYSGTQSLEDLANASGYQGPRNFQHAPPAS